jgi:hypothetical protein
MRIQTSQTYRSIVKSLPEFQQVWVKRLKKLVKFDKKSHRQFLGDGQSLSSPVILLTPSQVDSAFRPDCGICPPVLRLGSASHYFHSG